MRYFCLITFGYELKETVISALRCCQSAGRVLVRCIQSVSSFADVFADCGDRLQPICVFVFTILDERGVKNEFDHFEEQPPRIIGQQIAPPLQMFSPVGTVNRFTVVPQRLLRKTLRIFHSVESRNAWRECQSTGWPREPGNGLVNSFTMNSSFGCSSVDAAALAQSGSPVAASASINCSQIPP